ncbi:hypothetical protein RHMOL_Rhmol10G0277600 [Rhododendron molle]|uniref:Uncharacterized protein n=1 Tax=Rhododendron molle TaxID=49168 RepID=A0ACC0M729_RHOML|nr:hypothetical protein RHMOL_Rhmol10G0277600 [Rhododendron molle]
MVDGGGFYEGWVSCSMASGVKPDPSCEWCDDVKNIMLSGDSGMKTAGAKGGLNDGTWGTSTKPNRI